MQREVNGGAIVRVIGGAMLSKSNLGRVYLSYGLAVIEVAGRELVIRVRPRWLARLFGLHPLRLHPSDVSMLYPASQWLQRGIGIRMTAGDTICFWTRAADNLLSLLEAQGYPVSYEHRTVQVILPPP
jgi:hypothetical protein